MLAKLIDSYLKPSNTEKKMLGEVFTSLKLVEEMLDKLPKEVWSNPNLKWLDPANGIGNFPAIIVRNLMEGLKDWQPDTQLRLKHILENMIYVCELQSKNMFIYLQLFDPDNKYKMNFYRGSFLNRGFDGHMKEVWGVDKFDIVVGNPPFNQMIDMKFIRLSYEIANVTCIVHPSTWLLDEKGKQKAFTSTKELIKDHLDNIELFNSNGIFNIALFVPCVITYIDKNKKTKGIRCLDKINNIELIYDDINQINKYSDIDIYLKLKEKIKIRSSKSNLLNFKNKNTGNYFVNIAQIRGNVNFKGDKMIQDDFYTLITKDTKTSLENNKHMFFSFQTESESNNFITYLKSNFARFCLSIYKNNSQLDRGELEIIPWLDFTQEWTDEKLYREFDLTENEIKFIEKHIPKYYD
jgi:hypothetical protein